MSLIDTRSITESDRQRIIIEFIRSNPYCNAEDVVQGVKNDISRVTVFKTLDKLKESGAVQRYLENNQKRNAREHKLFVDESNPLVSVRLELEKFESAYFDLFNKAFLEVKLKVSQLRQAEAKPIDPTMKDELIDQNVTLMVNLLNIFYAMVDACLFRFLFIWSQKISDQKVLQQLYSMIFSKISEMTIRLFGGLKSAQGLNIYSFLDPFLQFRIRSAGEGELVEYLDSFKEFGMEKEIESVIDSLWMLIGDLQPNVYPEP
jgi:hypothetical protein